MVNHPHTPEQAAEVVEELRADGIDATEWGADVSRRPEFEAMVDGLIERTGRWDILVSNAAVAITQPLVAFDEAAIDRLFAVNVKGVIWGMQLAEDRMADGAGSCPSGARPPG